MNPEQINLPLGDKTPENKKNIEPEKTVAEVAAESEAQRITKLREEIEERAKERREHHAP